MRARSISRRMFRQQGGQSNRFLTKFFPDQMIAAGRFVAFVEKQVKRLQNAVEPIRQFIAGRNFKRNVKFANPLPRSRQAFRNGRFAG